jgi:hypothetical protein
MAGRPARRAAWLRAAPNTRAQAWVLIDLHPEEANTDSVMNRGFANEIISEIAVLVNPFETNRFHP